MGPAGRGQAGDCQPQQRMLTEARAEKAFLSLGLEHCLRISTLRNQPRLYSKSLPLMRGPWPSHVAVLTITDGSKGLSEGGALLFIYLHDSPSGAQGCRPPWKPTAESGWLSFCVVLGNREIVPAKSIF